MRIMIILKAVGIFLKKKDIDTVKSFGIWKKNKKNAVEFQRKLRQEW